MCYFLLCVVWSCDAGPWNHYMWQSTVLLLGVTGGLALLLWQLNSVRTDRLGRAGGCQLSRRGCEGLVLYPWPGARSPSRRPALTLRSWFGGAPPSGCAPVSWWPVSETVRYLPTCCYCVCCVTVQRTFDLQPTGNFAGWDATFFVA